MTTRESPLPRLSLAAMFFLGRRVGLGIAAALLIGGPPGLIAAETLPRFESIDLRGDCRGGKPNYPGRTLERGRTVELIAHGSEFGHHCGQDQGRFAFVAIEGDFDVAVQVASISNRGAQRYNGKQTVAKGGLMIREGNDPSGRFVAIWAVSNDDPEEYPDAFHFDARLARGAWLGSKPEGEFVYGWLNRRKHGELFVRDYPYVWLRLKRQANRFSAWVSPDGKTWHPTTIPGFELDLPRVLQVGLALTAAAEGDRNAMATAVFQDLRGFPIPPDRGKAGTLALHPENPRYLQWRGKPLVLVTSAEHYGAVLNLDFDYRKYLDTLAADGMTYTRVFTGAYVEPGTAFGIASNSLAPAAHRLIAPWARSNQPGYANGGNKFDLSRWDEAYFARLKDVVAHAAKQGIVVEVTLFCPMYDDAAWRLSPMNASNHVNGMTALGRTDVYTLDRNGDLLAVQERLTRKVVTELNGFDNVFFEICNEPYYGGVTMPWQHRIADVIVATEKPLPVRHLIAQNIANASAVITNPHPAISIFNFHYAAPPDAVATNYALNKVIGDDETGFRGIDDAPYRTEAWDFILAGGGLYNNLDYSFTVGHENGTFAYPATQPGGGNAGFRRQMKILSDFIHGFDFVRMKPDNAVIKGGVPDGCTVRALVEPGKAMAIYVRNEGTPRFWSARWTGFIIPPVDGEYAFHTISNDGIRLWVGEKPLIDNWNDHADIEDTGHIKMTGGQPYPVRLEYYYNGGNGVSKLSWTPPSGKKDTVPADVLRLPESGWGLRGEYFYGIDLAQRWGQRNDGQLNFTWGMLSPLPGKTVSGPVALQVELAEGDWRAEWLDTKSGRVVGESHLRGGAVRTLVAPRFETDIALRLLHK